MWSLSLIAVLWGPATEAVRSPIARTWSAPTECPSKTTVEGALGDFLESSPVQSFEMDVVATVTRTGQGYTLDLRIVYGGRTGLRRLATATCDEAVQATALFVAMTIDPSVGGWEGPQANLRDEDGERAEPLGDIASHVDESSTPADGTSPASSDPATMVRAGAHPPVKPRAGLDRPSRVRRGSPSRKRTRASTATKRRFAPRPLALIEGGAAGGLVPKWTGFVQLGAGAAWERVHLRAVVSGWLPQSTGVAALTGRFQLWTGGLLVCAILRPRATVAFGLCAGTHVGAMLGRGERGFAGMGRSTQPWMALALEPEVRIALHPWLGIALVAHLFVSPVRPAFDTDQQTFVYRENVVGGAFYGRITVRAADVRDTDAPGVIAHALPHLAHDTEVLGSRTRPPMDVMGGFQLSDGSADVHPHHEQLAQIYRDHVRFVARSLRRLGVADLHLDDLVQDAFLVVHRRLPDFDPARAPMRSWLYGIARGVAANYRRGAVRLQHRLELVRWDHEPTDGFADRVEAADLVERFLAGLKPIHREVFVLAEIEGLSGVEISHALGLNVNAVYARLRKTRQSFDVLVQKRDMEEVST